MKTLLCVSALLLALTAGLSAADSKAPEVKVLVNVDKAGVGLQGYDPVAFFTEKKPVKGHAGIVSRYNGVIYQFATVEDKKLFDENPAKYEPQFGGYCAYGVSRNKAVEIDVDAFQIVDGRLLLQYDKDIRDEFNKDTRGNLKQADKNWPDLVDKKGKNIPATALGQAKPTASAAPATAAASTK
ncbi:MAG TPA: YHS domain-containing (seleno)protein [Opitutales bacterium]|nr:YHS domain-containing (seleno)protein [Opitutales bacterium]